VSLPSGVVEGSRSGFRAAVQASWAFFLPFVVYLSNGGFDPIHDAAPNLAVALSIVEEGDWFLTPEECPLLFRWSLRTAERDRPVIVAHWDQIVDGRKASELRTEGLLKLKDHTYAVMPSGRSGFYVSIYGPGAGLCAVPAVGAAKLAGWGPRRHPMVLWYAGKITASLMAALSALFVFLAVRRWMNPWRSLGIAWVYGMGTCVWAVASQALWQQTPALLFISLGVWLHLREGGESSWSSAAAGLSFGLAAYCRPSAGIVLLAVGAGLLFPPRRALAPLAAGGLLPLAAMALTSWWACGTPLAFGQLQVADRCALIKLGEPGAWQTPLWEGAAGLLASPSRGLLVFSPILAAAFWGIWRVHRSEAWRPLRSLAWAALGMMFLAFKWFDWWGGWSFGYRLLLDALPLLAVLMVPVAEEVLESRSKTAVALALVGWSVLVQVLGAFAYTPGGWNARVDGYDVPLRTGMKRFETRVAAEEAARRGGIDPGSAIEIRMDVDNWEYRHRLWSVEDSQIPFLIIHFSEGRKARVDRMNQFLRKWE
jgi:hypothetical protein